MTIETFDAPVTLEQEGKPASLFLFADRVIWGSVGFRGGETARPAITLIIGAYKPVTITTHQTDVHSSRALLIDANVSRSLNAEMAGFYSLNLDPIHTRCSYLRDRVLMGQDVVDLADRLDPKIIAAVTSAIESPGGCKSALDLSEKIMDHFFPEAVSQSTPIDKRVASAAAWLTTHVPARPDLEKLAATCHLSQGRLVHLFTQELGVSIRTYLLWLKMRKAAELFARDIALTEVASTIGFSDSAHLSRVFRTYFSAAPSFLANRMLVRVHVCELPLDNAESREPILPIRSDMPSSQ